MPDDDLMELVTLTSNSVILKRDLSSFPAPGKEHEIQELVVVCSDNHMELTTTLWDCPSEAHDPKRSKSLPILL